MNKIICDECKAEIKMKTGLIETKYLKDGIQIRFFRCLSCRTKTLVDITDKATREKQIEIRKWADQRNKALDINIDNMSEEEVYSLATLADECLFNIQKLQEEIKEAKAELKVKYGDML